MAIPKAPKASKPRRAPRAAKPPVIVPEGEVQAGAETPGRWEFSISDWLPTPLNRLLNSHWAAAGRMKKHDRRMIATYSLAAGIPDAIGKRRVSLRITLPKGVRRHDIDAFQKTTLDACVQSKLLVNDSEIWAEWGGVTYERGECLSTTIILEDIS